MKTLILKNSLHRAFTKRFFLSLLNYKPCDDKESCKPRLNSINYEVKIYPKKYLLAYFKLTKLCELSNDKFFQCFPLRKSFIPCHSTIDTMILNNHILKNSAQIKLDKEEIWGQVTNLSCKAIKPQGYNKSIQYRGTIVTDGISVSVIKQNQDTSKGSSSNKSSDIIKHQSSVPPVIICHCRSLKNEIVPDDFNEKSIL